ncbi:uncharacterized protein [Anabrus simplex]|uniref:uncharacterized protein isoform X3 n=1 Tax=Anabrus simplex TaxID=316456 RepID=UPI0035A2F8AE
MAFKNLVFLVAVAIFLQFVCVALSKPHEVEKRDADSSEEQDIGAIFSDALNSLRNAVSNLTGNPQITSELTNLQNSLSDLMNNVSSAIQSFGATPAP